MQITDKHHPVVRFNIRKPTFRTGLMVRSNVAPLREAFSLAPLSLNSFSSPPKDYVQVHFIVFSFAMPERYAPVPLIPFVINAFVPGCTY